MQRFRLYSLRASAFQERDIEHRHSPGRVAAFDLRPDLEGVFYQWLIRGRYLDWFVQREGTWKILNRVAVFDWVEELRQFDASEEERFGARQPIGGKFPNDPVHEWFDRTR